MSTPVVDELIAKTFRELRELAKPTPRSRISRTSNGYIHLISWANASLLRVLVVRFAHNLPAGQHRLKAQVTDAARSVVANIEEGFGRPTTAEYLRFLGFSEASLVEVKGDIQRARQDSILPSLPGSSLIRLGIDLRSWHQALKASVISKPSPPGGTYRNGEEFRERFGPQDTRKSFAFLYPPVDDLRIENLTYEIFIELINKTSWHLRRLVVSLEDKLNRDQKFYEVERARIRSGLSWKR